MPSEKRKSQKPKKLTPEEQEWSDQMNLELDKILEECIGPEAVSEPPPPPPPDLAPEPDKIDLTIEEVAAQKDMEQAKHDPAPKPCCVASPLNFGSLCDLCYTFHKNKRRFRRFEPGWLAASHRICRDCREFTKKDRFDPEFHQSTYRVCPDCLARNYKAKEMVRKGVGYQKVILCDRCYRNNF